MAQYSVSVLVRYVYTLAAQFGTSPDPIMYFHTPDMRKTERWKPIPAHLVDPAQQAAWSFERGKQKEKGRNTKQGVRPHPPKTTID